MRTWLGLAGLLIAVLVLGVWIYFKPAGGEAPSYALSDRKAQTIRRIKLERTPQSAPPAGETAPAAPVTITLERASGEWRVTAPMSARADAFQVERLLAILDTRSSVRLPAADLPRYGLDRPVARLTLDDQVFSYGAANTVTREQYVLANGAVYAIPLSQRTALPRDADAILSRALFAPGEVPVRFTLPDFSLSLQEGRWELDPPRAELSADERNAWVDRWRNASAVRAAPARVQQPQSQVRIKLKDDRELTIGVLQRDPELVMVRQDEGVEYVFFADVARSLLAPPAGGEQANK